MRLVLQTVSVAVGLIAVEVPRGLWLAAVIAAVGIAHSLYAQQQVDPRFDGASVKANRSPGRELTTRDRPPAA